MAGTFSIKALGEGQLAASKGTIYTVPGATQAIIKTSCEKSYLSSLIKLTSMEPEAMESLKKDGVVFEEWEEKHLKKFEKIWNEIAEEESANDPLFAEVYQSHTNFRKKYAIWGERAYLK